MNDDLISRQAAIDALGEEPEVWSGKDEYEQGLNNQWHYDVNALKALPSAQPELNEWCHDCKEYDHDKHCCPRWNRVIKTTLADAQPEIVRCQDCRWGREVCGNIECFVDGNVPPEYHGYEWYCPNGERKADNERGLYAVPWSY